MFINSCANLELSLPHLELDSYRVGFYSNRPVGEADLRPPMAAFGFAKFSKSQIQFCWHN